MCPDAHPPALIGHRVVRTLITGVARRLHGVARERACRRGTVAGSNKNRVSCVAEMVRSGVFSGLRVLGVGVGRHGQAESPGGESLGHSFEGDHGQAIG